MVDFPELYFLRHGQTYWNAEGRMQGRLNSSLTSLGRKQAERQGEILASLDLSGFEAICSPQGRAFETAAIAVAPILPMIRTDPRLCEIDVGDWQGKLREGLWPDGQLDDGPDGPLAVYENAPGGEGFAGLEQRCADFLRSLQGPSVIVTHGITSRMMRSLVLGLGTAGVKQMPGGQGNVFHLSNGEQRQLN